VGFPKTELHRYRKLFQEDTNVYLSSLLGRLDGIGSNDWLPKLANLFHLAEPHRLARGTSGHKTGKKRSLPFAERRGNQANVE